MKKVIVVLCIKLYRALSGGIDAFYYMKVLDLYISPASDNIKLPIWYGPWIYKIEDWLFVFIKKNKDIAKEYHRAVIKKKNKNSKDGTVYV